MQKLRLVRPLRCSQLQQCALGLRLAIEKFWMGAVTDDHLWRHHADDLIQTVARWASVSLCVERASPGEREDGKQRALDLLFDNFVHIQWSGDFVQHQKADCFSIGKAIQLCEDLLLAANRCLGHTVWQLSMCLLKGTFLSACPQHI